MAFVTAAASNFSRYVSHVPHFNRLCVFYRSLSIECTKICADQILHILLGES